MIGVLLGGILMIGDSHTVGPFGKAFTAEWGSDVAVYAINGAGPASFVRGEKKKGAGWWVEGRRGTSDIRVPKLKKLLKRHKPELTVIALGSNPTDSPAVAKLLHWVKKSGSRCFWVGPPNMRGFSGQPMDYRYGQLREGGVGKDCALFDSHALPYLSYPKDVGDGAHYEGPLAPLAERWGRDASAFLRASKEK